MDAQSIVKPSFAVIGKEGSTREDGQFIQRLWEMANGHFSDPATGQSYLMYPIRKLRG